MEVVLFVVAIDVFVVVIVDDDDDASFLVLSLS